MPEPELEIISDSLATHRSNSDESNFGRRGNWRASFTIGFELTKFFSRATVNSRLVASLNRSGGNLTGFNILIGELGAKGLALLHELVPGIATIGFLGNPNNPAVFELMTRDVLAAAPVIGVKVRTLKAATDREIDSAFVSLVQARTGALLVGADLFSTIGSSGSLNLRNTTQFRLCTTFVSS